MPPCAVRRGPRNAHGAADGPTQAVAAGTRLGIGSCGTPCQPSRREIAERRFDHGVGHLGQSLGGQPEARTGRADRRRRRSRRCRRPAPTPRSAPAPARRPRSRSRGDGPASSSSSSWASDGDGVVGEARQRLGQQPGRRARCGEGQQHLAVGGRVQRAPAARPTCASAGPTARRPGRGRAPPGRTARRC